MSIKLWFGNRHLNKWDEQEGTIKIYYFDCIASVSPDGKTYIIQIDNKVYDENVLKNSCLEDNEIDTDKLESGKIYKLSLEQKINIDPKKIRTHITSHVELVLRDRDNYKPTFKITVSAPATAPSHLIEELKKFFEYNGADVTVVDEHPMEEHQIKHHEERFKEGYKLFEDTKVTLIANHEPWGG